MLPPSTSRISGPPPGPTPQGLSSMIPKGGMPPEDGLNEPKPGAGGAQGGLKDVFDEVQQVLDALASILPEQAEEIDEIKGQLAEILAKAISGGASFEGRTEEGPGGARPTPGLPA